MKALSHQSMAMEFEDAFERNPKICGGQPVIRGTRIPLRTVLASLAEGASFEDILRNFPTLTAQHLRAVVAFAASSAEEDLPVPGGEPHRWQRAYW
jgi:uncharacterized protein (DUF433 family)